MTRSLVRISKDEEIGLDRYSSEIVFKCWAWIGGLVHRTRSLSTYLEGVKRCCRIDANGRMREDFRPIEGDDSVTNQLLPFSLVAIACNRPRLHAVLGTEVFGEGKLVIQKTTRTAPRLLIIFILSL